MRRIMIFLFLSLVVGLAGFLVTRLVESRAQTQSVPAFTAFFVERHFAADGSEVHDQYATIAYKSDGSRAIAYTRESPDHEWMSIRVIRDLSGGKEIAVDPFTRSLITYPLSARTVDAYRKMGSALTFLPTSCTALPPSAPQTTMLGFQVFKTQQSTGFPGAPARQVNDETWVAPALGCFPIEETCTFTSPGGATTKFVRQTLSVIPGEPASALFEIPANYAERSPSQVFADFAKRYPSSPAMPNDSVAQLERAYESARKGQ